MREQKKTGVICGIRLPDEEGERERKRELRVTTQPPWLIILVHYVFVRNLVGSGGKEKTSAIQSFSAKEGTRELSPITLLTFVFVFATMCFRMMFNFRPKIGSATN